MRLSHTRTTKGKKVMVILRDGRRIIGHFEERRNARGIRLREVGWIPKSELRAFIICKGEMEQQWGDA